MSAELSNAMTAYYDFLVAYENLLRDGGSFNTVPVTCTNAKMNVGAWPLQTGKVAVQGKKIGAVQVLHFINLPMLHISAGAIRMVIKQPL